MWVNGSKLFGQPRTQNSIIGPSGQNKALWRRYTPRAIIDFEIPDELLKAKVTTARMVSPTNRSVDIPIENGYVGMVDREEFDEFLRERAAKKVLQDLQEHLKK